VFSAERGFQGTQYPEFNEPDIGTHDASLPEFALIRW
jgi:hypothetical protein